MSSLLPVSSILVLIQLISGATVVKYSQEVALNFLATDEYLVQLYSHYNQKIYQIFMEPEAEVDDAEIIGDRKIVSLIILSVYIWSSLWFLFFTVSLNTMILHSIFLKRSRDTDKGVPSVVSCIGQSIHNVFR